MDLHGSSQYQDRNCSIEKKDMSSLLKLAKTFNNFYITGK